MVYYGDVLPDWFDFHALQLTISAAMGITALGAIIVAARVRHLAVRASLAVVLLAATGAMFAYYQGPMHRGEEQCAFRFLKSDLAIDGCLEGPSGVAAR